MLYQLSYTPSQGRSYQRIRLRPPSALRPSSARRRVAPLGASLVVAGECLYSPDDAPSPLRCRSEPARDRVPPRNRGRAQAAATASPGRPPAGAPVREAVAPYARQLSGGDAPPRGATIYLAPQEVGLGEREAIKDVARVLARYIDIVAVSTFDQAIIRGVRPVLDDPGRERAHRSRTSLPGARRSADGCANGSGSFGAGRSGSAAMGTTSRRA